MQTETQPTTTPTQAAPAIRLMKHYATNGTTKARCWYSKGSILKKGTNEHLECVTVYAKDYSDALALVFGAENYHNDTDMMTDYFEKGRVRIFPADPLYAAALALATRKGA